MHMIVNHFPDSGGVGRPGNIGGNPNSSGGNASRDRGRDLPGNQNRDSLHSTPTRDNPQKRGGSTPNRAENPPRKRGRGFASMDPQRVSEIASLGGKAAHAQGVAHEWSAEEARAAGRKGGQASRGARGGQQKNLQAGAGGE